MDGLGVRVFKSGKLTVGRWQTGALLQPLDLQEVSTAVQAADRAAQAACEVKVCQSLILIPDAA